MISEEKTEVRDGKVTIMKGKKSGMHRQSQASTDSVIARVN